MYCDNILHIICVTCDFYFLSQEIQACHLLSESVTNILELSTNAGQSKPDARKGWVSKLGNMFGRHRVRSHESSKSNGAPEHESLFDLPAEK